MLFTEAILTYKLSTYVLIHQDQKAVIKGTLKFSEFCHLTLQLPGHGEFTCLYIK